MITSSVKMILVPKKREIVLELIGLIIELTQVQPGCISCCVYQDVKNRNIIIYVEKWKRQVDLERHIRSPRYLNILSAIDISSEPPEICFDTITDTYGLEFIKAIRSEKENSDINDTETS